MTLKDLILQLEQLPTDKPVVYSDGKFPGQLHSYRGDYSELALDRRQRANYDDWDTDRYQRLPTPTAAILLSDARDAVSKTFGGYKGGNYSMADSTDVWVSEEGRADGLRPLGFLEEPDRVVLLVSDGKSLVRLLTAQRDRIAALEAKLAEVTA